ncbi:MAG: putative toxin-antitoxin system toxin component, PIN family [Eggerthellaceae bacterium]|nr:putative toxin-antitoxin system toxin component, PIN family [Eggerthellaceae bacterium]
MINIVLDTNVLAAALLKPGGSNRACLQTVIGNDQLFSVCYSSQMMAEYREVLNRPFVTGRGLSREADALLSLVERVGEEIVPKFIPALVYPDIDDKPFLEAAVYVDAILITNNIKDYPFLGVRIVGPDEFGAWWRSFSAR